MSRFSQEDDKTTKFKALPSKKIATFIEKDGNYSLCSAHSEEEELPRKKGQPLKTSPTYFDSIKKAEQKFELKFDTTVSNKTCTSLFNKTQVTVIASKRVNVGIDGSYEVFINEQKLVQES